MLFAAAAVSLALVATARAQSSVTINSVSLTQCASAQLSFQGSAPPYYVAVLPATNPCGSDALAEFHDVWGGSVDYYANVAAGIQIQVYVLDANGVENFGQIETIGGGDGSCLGSGAPPADNNTPAYTPPAYTPPAYTPPAYTPPAYTPPAYTPPADAGNNANAYTPPTDTGANTNPPVDNPPVDNTPPANPPVDNTPPASPPVDNTPPVDTPVDNTPPVNPPVDTPPQDAGSNSAVPSSGSTLASSVAAGSTYVAPSYVEPSEPASSSVASSSTNGAGNVAQAPVDSGNGAVSVTASVTLALGAFTALFALL